MVRLNRSDRWAGVTGVVGVFLLPLTIAACGGGGTDVTDDPGQQGPVDETKPTSLPSFASLHLYSAESPLNQRIGADPEIDPESAMYVAKVKQAADEGGVVIELKQYTTSVFFTDSSTPKKNVTMACGPQWAGVSKLTGVPMPSFAEPTQDVDGADNPIRKGKCGEDADQDNQLVVLDLVTRCEYDFFQMRLEDGVWVASWGNSISMDGTGVYPGGFSARGSGFTQLAGEIWPDELQAGRITHALIFSYPAPAAGGPVAPATESDGLSEEANALPEGALLQLDPDLDLTTLGLTAYEMTIARALQEYGMYLVDSNGVGVSLEAIDPRSVQENPYDGLLPDEDFPALSNIPMGSLRVLKLGPQNPLFDEENSLVDSGCATFS
jgi:hypothetical protein